MIQLKLFSTWKSTACLKLVNKRQSRTEKQKKFLGTYKRIKLESEKKNALSTLLLCGGDAFPHRQEFVKFSREYDRLKHKFNVKKIIKCMQMWIIFGMNKKNYQKSNFSVSRSNNKTVRALGLSLAKKYTSDTKKCTSKWTGAQFI
jgi:hypothetical protein